MLEEPLLIDTIPSLTAIALNDFLAQELPPREIILSPWLTSQSLNMLYAWRGVGKTHVALGIGIAVASGGEFLGWKSDKPRGVLYIDGEMPANAMQERLAKICYSKDSDFSGENFRLITPDLQTGFMPDLATKEGQNLVDKLILPSTNLIIIDNLSCLVRSGGRENDAESWLNIGQWALEKRIQGKSILFIHHAAKNGNQRGTSKKEDILDTVISLKKPSDYSPESGARFEVHFEKARHMSGKDNESFIAQLIQEEQKLHWQTMPLLESNKLKIVELYKEGLSKIDIANDLGIDRSTVYRSLNKAMEEGLIPKSNKVNKI